MRKWSLNRIDVRALLFAYLSMFYLGLMDNGRGPIFPALLSELGLDDEKGSLFFAIASFASLFSAMIGESLHGIVSLFTIIRVGTLTLILGGLGICLGNSAEVVFASCAVFGFSFGILNFGQNMAIQLGAEAGMRRSLLSGLHAMYGVSSLASPFLIGWLLKDNWSWRSTWYCLLVFGCVGLFVSLWIRATQGMKARESFVIRTDQAPLHAYQTHSKAHFLWVAGILGFATAAEIGISSRLSLYLFRMEHLSLADASWALAIFFLLMFLGRLVITSHHFSTLSNQRLLAVSFILSIVCSLLGFWVHYSFLILTGLTLSPAYPTFMAFLHDIFSLRLSRATTWSLTITAGAVVLSHLAIGWLSEHFDLRWALHSAPLGLVFALFLLFFRPRLWNVSRS